MQKQLTSPLGVAALHAWPTPGVYGHAWPTPAELAACAEFLVLYLVPRGDIVCVDSAIAVPAKVAVLQRGVDSGCCRFWYVVLVVLQHEIGV